MPKNTAHHKAFDAVKRETKLTILQVPFESKYSSDTEARKYLLDTSFLLPAPVRESAVERLCQHDFVGGSTGWYGDTMVNNILLDNLLIPWSTEAAKAAKKQDWTELFAIMVAIAMCVFDTDGDILSDQEIWLEKKKWKTFFRNMATGFQAVLDASDEQLGLDVGGVGRKCLTTQLKKFEELLEGFDLQPENEDWSPYLKFRYEPLTPGKRSKASGGAAVSKQTTPKPAKRPSSAAAEQPAAKRAKKASKAAPAAPKAAAKAKRAPKQEKSAQTGGSHRAAAVSTKKGSRTKKSS